MSEQTSTTQESNDSDYRQRIKHTVEQADRYQHRNKRKHQEEMQLIERGLQQLTNVRTFLDAPCGVGRASMLLSQKGYKVTGVDLGEGALQAARETVEAAKADVVIERADLEQLPYETDAFDACLCFRFIHHLPTAELRDKIIGELCRVSRNYVLISYLSPMSVTSVRRAFKQRFFGKTSVQHHTPLATLKEHFRHHGFELQRDLAQMPYIHSLHLAVFKRIK